MQKSKTGKITDRVFYFLDIVCDNARLFSIFPQIADWMSELVGVYSTTNFIFLLIIFILLVKCFQLTMDISKLDNKVKELVQKIAIDEKEKREQK